MSLSASGAITRVPAALAAAVLTLVVGCGGESGSPGLTAAAPPEECVSSWNEAPETLIFGKHVYTTHQARQAEVSEIEPGRGAINIRQDQTCAVVFSVPPNDYEYGDVGLAKTRFGWASIQELDRGDPGRLVELQRSAAEKPNVLVFPDGTIGEG